MTVRERIKAFVASKSISVRAFEQRCGLANGLVNNITESVSNTTIDKISKEFPELNIGWVLTGEGQMLKTDDQQDHFTAFKESEIETWKKLFQMQTELLEEVKRDRDRLQKLLDEKQ